MDVVKIPSMQDRDKTAGQDRRGDIAMNNEHRHNSLPDLLRRALIHACLWLGLVPLAAGGATQDAESFYQQGYAAYEADDYEKAVALLEKATHLDQQQSEYYHYLGKSYGKLASQSNWFRAVDLSQKTREALERAVQLDANNERAVIDLIKFYRQAPAFLGGDDRKADALEKRLAELRENPSNTAHY